MTNSAWSGDYAVTVRQILALAEMAEARILGGLGGQDRLVNQVRIAPEGRHPEGDFENAAVLMDGRRLAEDNYLVDFVLRWMDDCKAPLLIIVSPQGYIGLATRRLANKLSITVIEVQATVLHLTDSIREVVEAPIRGIARGIVNAVEGLSRVSPQNGVRGFLNALDTALESSSALLGLEGETVFGELSKPFVDEKDRVGAAVWIRGEQNTRLIQPIALALGEAPTFWLVVESQSPTPAWEQTATTVVKIASSHIVARLVSDRLERERDARFRLGMLNEIIAVQDKPSASVIQDIGTLGWKTVGWCTAIHIRVAGGDSLRVLSLTDELSRQFADAGFSGPLIERSDGWTTWTVSHAEPPPTSYGESVVQIRMALQRFIEGRSGLRVYAGIGHPYTGVVGLKKSLAEGQEAATIAQAGGGRTGVQHIDELGVERILFGWYTSNEFGDFARTLLKPVTQVDKDEDLMRTLEVYLDNESSPTVTAGVLGLHRNTVVNRISRLRQLLSVDLDDPDQRLAVQLACRVVNLNNT
ncbi:CdaR family transcriptional regulator [Paenarthrobacter sp. YJN-5]|uniref:PucR family transcriptional regulator n=1 Tax=unclassified Paenarthrobacter TaxID=2634190 RepID=UPI00187753EA|nr:helix-turn-helix domain-containing protein [Paenarthrobacter sp. YJN-5]QOT19928.1 helix-turn-helix domain-containing protein [Paenarthrobacter sp. YJN-5]